MFAEVPIRMEHVPFQEKRVHVRLLAPVVIANVFKRFSDLAANRQIRFPARSQGNELDGVPNVPAQGYVLQKTPILVFPQKAISTDWRWRVVVASLGVRARTDEQEKHSKICQHVHCLNSAGAFESGFPLCSHQETERLQRFADQQHTARPASPRRPIWPSPAYP